MKKIFILILAIQLVSAGYYKSYVAITDNDGSNTIAIDSNGQIGISTALTVTNLLLMPSLNVTNIVCCEINALRAGNTFIISGLFTISGGGQGVVCIDNTNDYNLRMNCNILANGTSVVNFYEKYVRTNITTQVIPLNHNRTSTKTNNCKFYLCDALFVTNYGIRLLTTGGVGSNQNVNIDLNGNINGSKGWILKTNEVYAILVTNVNASTSTYFLELEYELE